MSFKQDQPQPKNCGIFVDENIFITYYKEGSLKVIKSQEDKLFDIIWGIFAVIGILAVVAIVVFLGYCVLTGRQLKDIETGPTDD